MNTPRDEFESDNGQWPLSPLDDHLIHQTPEPIRIVWTTDIRTYDRHWMVAHSLPNDLAISTGGSFYPNLNMAEGYAIVNLAGTHTAVRATRSLGADRSDLTIGPLRPSIIRGLREWRFQLDENDYGIRFDLSWYDTTRQVLRDPHAGPPGMGQPPGRHRDQNAGFECFGELEGWVEANGERFELTRSTCKGTRDRHWGFRNGIGGPSQLFGARPPRGGNGLQFVNFGDWAIWGDRIFYPLGSKKKAEEIVHTERHLSFETDFPLFHSGTVINVLASGERKTLHYERVGNLTAFLRAGFYGGPNGGAPGSDRWQGELPADRPLEGESIDVSTAAGKSSLSGLNSHVCSVTCDGQTASGVFQTYDPHAYRRCQNRVPGWSFA